jgi:hypothetical protein
MKILLTKLFVLFIWYQESSSQLAMGSTFGPEAPTEQVLD